MGAMREVGSLGRHGGMERGKLAHVKPSHTDACVPPVIKLLFPRYLGPVSCWLHHSKRHRPSVHATSLLGIRVPLHPVPAIGF